MASNTEDDDDFGEEVFTGRVKAATLPMGGPASRRVKKKVEGGPIAKGWHPFLFFLTLKKRLFFNERNAEPQQHTNTKPLSLNTL